MLRQRFHGRQFLSLHSLRYIGAGQHMDPRLLSLVKHILQRIGVVYGGICVSHHYNCGKTALCRRPRACQNVFLIREAGIPEMYMHIHQPRGNQKAFRVNHPAVFAGRCQLFSDFFDSVLINQQIVFAFQAGFRVNHISVTYQQHVALLLMTEIIQAASLTVSVLMLFVITD